MMSDQDAANGSGELPIDNAAASLSMADVNIMEKGSSSHSETLVDTSETSGSFPAFEEDTPSTTETAKAPPRSCKKKCCLFCCIPFALLVFVILILIAVGLSDESYESATNIANDPTRPSNPSAPAPVPAPAPTSPETEPQRPSFDEIKAWLVQQKVSIRQDIKARGTPQHKAVKWLADEDGAALPLPTVSIKDRNSKEGYMYMVRYVMAVLYYAMDGDNWTTKVNFMTDKDVCDWLGLSQRTNGNLIGSELGGLLCQEDTGMPGILDLEFNKLSGEIPSEIGLLTTLTHLDVEYNNVTGTIPAELCNLSNLEYMSLKVNQMTGPIPACFSQLKNLEYLNLRDNEYTGTLPSSQEFCDLTNMKVIVFDRNFVEGPIPECIGQWENLQLLSLADNLFTGQVPDLSKLTDLRELYLDGNQFEGNPISVLNKLTALRLLYIEDNMFTGKIDEDFVQHLVQLTALDISSNNFTDSEYGIPPHLFGLEKLHVLDFAGNRLKGALPTEIPLNTKLRFLSVHENEMRGGIPSQLTNLTGLWHLDLSNNNFHGPVREELFDMTSLYHLFLAENPNLHAGPIPSSLSNMIQLREFSMKNTNRTGALPDLVGFEDLKVLDLDNNQFTGTIPSSYGQLVKLRHLLLNRNNLVGSLPDFSLTPDLTTVLLDKTGVTGDFSGVCELPVFMGEAKVEGDPIFVADCSDPNSGITCACCHCCSKNQPKCSDPQVASLDWTWENEFRRVARDFVINHSMLQAPTVSATDTSP